MDCEYIESKKKVKSLHEQCYQVALKLLLFLLLVVWKSTVVQVEVLPALMLIYALDI